MTELFNVSTSDQRIIHELPHNVIKEIKEYPEIIIYGAGAVCRDVIRLLGRERIDRFNIAVTELNDEKKYVMGNQVHEISDYLDVADSALVLIAVTKKYQEEIINNLKDMGFLNIINVVE